MAYFSHVHWNWIKQRPHFLIEELSAYYTIDLFYINRLFYKYGIINEMNIKGNSKIRELQKLPFSSRLNLIQLIEKVINKRVIDDIIGYKYVWITSPVLLQFIPTDFLENKIVIYDCMDDYLAFDINKKKYNQNLKAEITLISKADYIITSSEYLKQKLIRNYSRYMNREPDCVNNGISHSFIQKTVNNISDLRKSEYINIMYIGTVANWIDFQLLLKTVERFSNIIFTLIGPVEAKVPIHDRIIVKGPIAHHLLPEYAAEADAFIMPFKVTELIQSVNPVKIYEYLSFNKPVFSIRYSEMDQFSSFVLLYSDEEELFSLIMRINSFTMNKNKLIEINNFLNKNTWKERASDINRILS